MVLWLVVKLQELFGYHDVIGGKCTHLCNSALELVMLTIVTLIVFCMCYSIKCNIRETQRACTSSCAEEVSWINLIIYLEFKLIQIYCNLMSHLHCMKCSNLFQPHNLSQFPLQNQFIS